MLAAFNTPRDSLENNPDGADRATFGIRKRGSGVLRPDVQSVIASLGTISRVSEQVETGVADQYANRGTSQHVAKEMHSQDDAR